MLPDAQVFAQEVGEMGIANNTKVVVYDRNYGVAAARAWWMFKHFGHDAVYYLDGGLTAWLNEDLPLELGWDNVAAYPRVDFDPSPRPQLVRNMQQMLENVEKKEEVVVDARSAARFTGQESEPRPGLQRGRLPGSLNVPFSMVFGEADQHFKSPVELEEMFKNIGLDVQGTTKPIVTTCGSGTIECTFMPVFDLTVGVQV